MADRTPDLEGYAKAPVELPHVRILRLQPDDILLLTTPYQLSDQEMHEIGSRMAERFPDHKCVLLENGLQLDILRKDGEQ